MTASAQNLVAIANGQVGYVESGGRDGHSGNITKYGAAYGLNGYAWCSMFVWWCFEQLGIDTRHAVTGSYASAEGAMEGFAKHGWKIVKNPRLGDVVFFHFSGEHAGANHTGIVVGADSGGVHTIEGNTSSGTGGSQVNGGGVYRRYRPYSVIIGYGRYPWSIAAPAAPKPVPVHGKTYPTLQYPMGMPPEKPSSAVHNMQKLLHLNPDGCYSKKVADVVGHFQDLHHLHRDGIAGPATLKVMGY